MTPADRVGEERGGAEALHWLCDDCRFEARIQREAIAHAEDADHWLSEHPHGFRGNAATRTMHASDYGGVYVDGASPTTARRDADDYKRRLSEGVF